MWNFDCLNASTLSILSMFASYSAIKLCLRLQMV